MTYHKITRIPLDKSQQWINAINDEMQSLKENETFEITQLPQGKKAVGVGGSYTLKSDVDGSDKYKARFVAKGYRHKQGVDFFTYD